MRMYVKVILFFVEFASSHIKSRTNVGIHIFFSILTQFFNFKRKQYNLNAHARALAHIHSQK